MHFSEIIKLPLIWKGTPYIALYFKAFPNIVDKLSLKNAWLPASPIFFLDFIISLR